jgi:hypothetical protein
MKTRARIAWCGDSRRSQLPVHPTLRRIQKLGAVVLGGAAQILLMDGGIRTGGCGHALRQSRGHGRLLQYHWSGGERGLIGGHDQRGGRDVWSSWRQQSNY